MAEYYGNFIGGNYVTPRRASWFDSVNPANREECLGMFVDSGRQEVAEAVDSIVSAAPQWAGTSGTERAAILQMALVALAERKEELARVMTREQGKPLQESLNEIGKSISEAQFMLGEGYRLNGYTTMSEKPGTWAQTVRVPVGPVAAITPWNFPVLTPMRKLMPALITGNTAVLKPSEYTPLTGLKLVEILNSRGLPKGVLNAVTGGRSTGEALVKHHAIKAITFTGSTAAGRSIYKLAAERLVRVQAEMGGKNPAVVWDPPSMQEAVKHIVSAAFLCSGQRCTAISRVIVRKADTAEIEQAFAAALSELRPGNGLENGVTLGPLTNEAQLSKVSGFVQRAVQEGARLVLGGEPLKEGEFAKGFFFPATLLADVTGEMEIAREEVFGPVLIVQAVETFEEALAMANNVEYGLTAAIFTKDLSVAGRFVDGIQAGMVHVNHGTAPESHMPFGGVKASGVGPGSVGPTTKDFFTDIKSVYLKHS
ncbi:aldehyde dehydrogenase family protein [Paenibacillus allorhizosphaerae]|uniref:Aldehyde dehydrogenase, thermostable n=1 Tax=Paenibacillus allorhizosphaerae TaxID=2849866 RepID=A0ABM8VAL4_9BACL|nr:aldehyde dehydrogenase family protein [Paenibacillus allorhizosphaerae]CAG7616831.1 Aldehyde dehydrogenase, thermostable [Paenibacillus allorhizosphaerae]